jgi:hypothetical protein
MGWTCCLPGPGSKPLAHPRLARRGGRGVRQSNPRQTLDLSTRISGAWLLQWTSSAGPDCRSIGKASALKRPAFHRIST